MKTAARRICFNASPSYTKTPYYYYYFISPWC